MPTRTATRVIRPFHWLPKTRNTQVKIEINGIDETSSVGDSSWIRPVTSSIGSFSIKLKNAGGQLTEKYSEGQAVKFYADNSNATRLKFWGRIDYAKDVMSKEGRFLEIEGRHRAYLLNETTVCHKAENTEISQILKNIIDDLPSSYGFTYSNVNATNPIVNINVEWNYVPFWDCVLFLCKKAGFDCYVDNDLDFHFFKEGSIENNDEAVVEGQMFIKISEAGTDDYYKKTRVIGVGKMTDGITPIIYTAISITEGSEIREVKVEDYNLSTLESVQAMAEGELLKLENRAKQASIVSHGLETLEPGQKFWVSVPRLKIHDQSRAIQITDKFGEKGWTTETITEEEILEMEDLIKQRIRKEEMLSTSDNINKLNYSYNFSFDNDDLTLTHNQTHVNNGILELSSSDYSEGTWISQSKSLSANGTRIELRYTNAKDIGAGHIYFRFTSEESDWQEFGGQRLLKTPITSGNRLQIKINLIKNSANPWPAIDSISVLYS